MQSLIHVSISSPSAHPLEEQTNLSLLYLMLVNEPASSTFHRQAFAMQQGNLVLVKDKTSRKLSIDMADFKLLDRKEYMTVSILLILNILIFCAQTTLHSE
jgi:hypothetical protein